MPCCGCWSILPNGSFIASGMCIGLQSRCNQYVAGKPSECDPRMQSQRDAEIRAELAMGLEIIPTGLMHQDNASAYLLEEYWARPGSMASAVELVRRNGWAGLGLDNEASAQGDARLPGKLASFIGNLSAALHGAGFRLVVDVTSTWHGNIAGPEYLPMYGRAAAPSTVFMDMATYFNSRPNHMSMAETLSKLSAMVGGPGRAAAGVGAEMLPGHFNASCDTPTNCLDYRWNHTAFARFVRTVEAAGVPEIDVYRFDRDPPPGTVSALAPWMVSELKGFLDRGPGR